MQCGRLEDVQQFAKKKNRIHDVDEYDNTPLYYACICGQYEIAKFLLEQGARDDKFGRCYISALVCFTFSYKIEYGNQRIIKKVQRIQGL